MDWSPVGPGLDGPAVIRVRGVSDPGDRPERDSVDFVLDGGAEVTVGRTFSVGFSLP